jgi:hypothetical protein
METQSKMGQATYNFIEEYFSKKCLSHVSGDQVSETSHYDHVCQPFTFYWNKLVGWALK